MFLSVVAAALLPEAKFGVPAWQRVGHARDLGAIVIVFGGLDGGQGYGTLDGPRTRTWLAKAQAMGHNMERTAKNMAHPPISMRQCTISLLLALIVRTCLYE